MLLHSARPRQWQECLEKGQHTQTDIQTHTCAILLCLSLFLLADSASFLSCACCLAPSSHLCQVTLASTFRPSLINTS